MSTNAAAAPGLPPPAPSTSSPPAANSASTSRRALVSAGAPSPTRLTVAAPSASSRSPLLRRRRRRPQPGDARLASPRRRVAGDLAGSSAPSSVRDHDEDALTSATASGQRYGALDGALERRPRLVDRLDLQTVREHSRRRRVARDRKERRSQAANATGRRGAPRAGRAGRPSPPCALQARRARRASIAATRRRRRRRPRPGPLALDPAPTSVARAQALQRERSDDRRRAERVPTRDARRAGSAGSETKTPTSLARQPSCLATAKATTAASTSGASHSGVVRPITEVSAETSGAATAPPRPAATLRAAEGRTTRNVAVGVRLRKRPRAGPRSRRSSRASRVRRAKYSPPVAAASAAGRLVEGRARLPAVVGPDGGGSRPSPHRVDGDAERARQLGAGRGVDRRVVLAVGQQHDDAAVRGRPAQVVDGARERHRSPCRRRRQSPSRRLGNTGAAGRGPSSAGT